MPRRYRLLFVFALIGAHAALAQPFVDPVAEPDSFFVEPAGVLTLLSPGVLANDSDADGDSLVAVLVSGPAHGELTLEADGGIEYRPDAGFEGADGFTYLARTVPVQQLGVDETASQVDFGATISNVLLGSQSDEDTVSLSGSLRARLVHEGTAIDSIHVTAMQLQNRDPLALKFEYGNQVVGLTLEITAPEDSIAITMAQPGQPGAVLAPFSLFEQLGNSIDVTAAIDLQASGSLAGAVPSGPQKLETSTTLDIRQSAVTIRNDEVRVVIPISIIETVDLDGNNVDLEIIGSIVAAGALRVAESSQAVAVRLQVGMPPANAAPIVAQAPATIDLRIGGADYSSDLSAWFIDPDGDSLSHTVSADPDGIVATTLEGGLLTISGQSPGSTEVSVTASDGRGGTATAAFTVNAIANNPPEAQPIAPEVAFVEGDSAAEIDVSAWFSDPDGDAMTFEATSSDEGVASLSLADALLTLTPGIPGTASVTVEATDVLGASASQVLLVTVGANGSPVASGFPTELELDGDEGSLELTVSEWFTDPEQHPLTYSAESSDSAVVQAALSEGSLTLEPVAPGSALVTVSASDGRGGEVAVSIAISVFTNDPPAIASSPDPLEMLVGSSEEVLDVAAFFVDPDGDDLEYAVEVGDDELVQAVLDGSTLTITALVVGSTNVTISASDPRGESASLDILVDIPSGVATERELPRETWVGTPYPSPAAGSVRLPFSLTEAQSVTVSMYDMLGRRLEVVSSAQHGAGTHEAAWSVSSHAAGMYLVRIEAGSQVWTRTLIRR